MVWNGMENDFSIFMQAIFFHSTLKIYVKLVIQNLCRQPQWSVTVRRFRKQKSCCLVIAIPQAGIAPPTLAVMQAFQAKKRLLGACSFQSPRTASILHILPFHAFVTQARIQSWCDGWKMNALTTTLHSSQQCSSKMSYLNQMYDKKAIEGYTWLRLPAWLLHDQLLLFVTQVRVETGCDLRKANALSTTLRQSQQCNNKMSYLNQMYEKKAIEGYSWLHLHAWLLHD